MVAVFLAVAACSGGGGEKKAPPETAVAATKLVDAVHRSLTTTWALQERFDRLSTTGQRIGADQHRAQRPPDRVTAAGGTIDARVNGRVVACATDASGTMQCRDGGPASPYDEDVASGVAAMDQLVRGRNGTPALYAVADERHGCFRLRLRQPGFVAPPYGTTARLCFDAKTGAPIRTEIERPEGTDTTVATEVRAEVSDADLAVPTPGR